MPSFYIVPMRTLRAMNITNLTPRRCGALRCAMSYKGKVWLALLVLLVCCWALIAWAIAEVF